MDNELSKLEDEYLKQLRRFKHIKPTESMMPDGITSNEGFALKMIEICEKTGDEGRPGVIAKHLQITKSGVSQILRSLCEKGLITREQSNEDFRVTKLRLTEEGKAMSARMDEMREEQMHQVIKDFGVEDFKTFVALLDKFATCMEANR